MFIEDQLFVPHQGEGIALAGLPRTGKGSIASLLTDAYGVAKVWKPSTGTYLEEYLKSQLPKETNYDPTREEKYAAGLRLQAPPNEDFFVREFTRQAYLKIVHGNIRLFVIDALRRLKEAETAHQVGMDIVVVRRPLEAVLEDLRNNPRPDETGEENFMRQREIESVETLKIEALPYVIIIDNDGSLDKLRMQVFDKILKGRVNATF